MRITICDICLITCVVPIKQTESNLPSPQSSSHFFSLHLCLNLRTPCQVWSKTFVPVCRPGREAFASFEKPGRVSVKEGWERQPWCLATNSYQAGPPGANPGGRGGSQREAFSSARQLILQDSLGQQHL